jgi:methyl-accepting chemotaxis protein
MKDNSNVGKTRIKCITKHPLQHKYLGLIIVSMILPLIIVGGCLYYLMFQVMADQLAMPETIAENLMPVFHKINFILLVSVPVIVVVIFIFAVVLTHRLFGPLERLENDICKIAQGDYSVRINMRQDDDLKPVAELVNTIIEKLEKK